MAKQPIDILLDEADWRCVKCGGIGCDCTFESSSDGMLYATHTGIIRICDAELECAVLNNGMRVFTEESLMKFLGSLDAI